VILCDASPLVALIDRADEHHAQCASTLRQLPGPALVTTWACFAEAMYLLGRRGGFAPQDALWSYVDDGALSLDIPLPGEWERMWELMEKYRDLPMDLADASLVTAAERLGVYQVFTVDRHFHAYRIQGTDAFQVIP
jgi:predicted nucleic acid-binding protein